LDITADIDSSVNNYSLFIPPQPNGLKGAYMLFYLYIVFENPILPKINCTIFINTQDVAVITNYNLTNLSPISNLEPVCLSVATNHFCDTVQDGSYITVNGNNIGLLGGDELNSNLKTCVGSWANYAHYNDSLFGLDDDTPDSLMGGTDCLADIKSYVNNGDTAVNVTFTYQTPSWQIGRLTNPIRAVMLSYATPCDTFSTTITPNDTICLGDSVQLQATGGVQYTWFGAFGGLSDTTIANPIATPSQTTTYLVTIKNDSGCVKTEQVKIWINPMPIPNNLTTTTTLCNDSSGSLTVGNISSNTAPYSYTLTNLQTLNTITQTQNTFNNLNSGNYLVQITDKNGCSVTDTILINDIQVNCTVPDTLELTIPNVFSPNGDGSNDNFVIQINGASLIKELKVEIFNRWGMLVQSSEFGGANLSEIPAFAGKTELVVWDGRTTAAALAPAGTYFYNITYTTLDDKVKSEKGSVTLLR